MKLDENQRFEIINMLYFRETGYYRPGKSHPEQETSSQENIDRFDLFCKENLLNRALEAIFKRDLIMDQIATYAECAPEITAKQANFDEDILELNNIMVNIREIFG